MKLINTEGLALIGPGSEWFWTAVSGLILGITFVAIYRQLRLHRAATTFQQAAELVHEWDGERMLRARVAVLEAMSTTTDPATWPEHAAAAIGDYWERVGNLVQEGHVDHDQVNGNTCRMWWARLSPFASLGRDRFGDPEIFIHFERLADVYAREDAKAGITVAYDQPYLDRLLSGSLASARGALGAAEDLRSVIVREAPGGKAAHRAR